MLNCYDFGARFYDPVLGRWFTPDAEEQVANPYLYCGNNPMMYVDPDGNLFLIDDFIVGFFKGLFSGKNPFKTGAKAFGNSARIWGGLFAGDFKQTLSRLTWELPQTLLGFLGAHGTNMFGTVDKVEHYDGATVLQKRGGTWGALTLGSYIIGDRTIEADPNNSLFQHEYGHYLQSRAYGPFYLNKFALPSLFDAFRNENKWDHNYYATEQDANVRALSYWEKKFPGFSEKSVSGYNPNGGWNFRDNPINGWDIRQSFNSTANQQALRDNRIKFHKFLDVINLAAPIIGSVPFHIMYSNWDVEQRRKSKK